MKNHQWHKLTALSQLDQIDQESGDMDVVVFKHSTRCGISAMTEDALMKGIDWDQSEFKFYYLDLLNHRDISNQIAERYGVVHQSPQLILIREGRAVDSVTHHAVRPNVIQSWISKTSA